jgi:AcrR family transcriptional regulator
MNDESTRRAYRQSARADAAEATARRILDAFVEAIREHWFDEIRLQDVARAAGVTVQTVIRRFGSKEGLLEGLRDQVGAEVQRRRRVLPGDLGSAIAALTEDYEATGDMIMRLLAQEDRYPAIRAVTDLGRVAHRAWLAATFEPALARLPAGARQPTLDALVAATDLYVWKLYRRDMGRSAAEYRRAVAQTVRALLNQDHRQEGSMR